jgi:peptide/nickel transport system permease protein
MVRHVLPNAIPIVIVITMIDVGQVVLVESALSFLGLGVQPPTAT